MEKEQIRKYGLEIGVDAVGFVALEDYKSPKSPDPKSYLPKARSIIVLAHRSPSAPSARGADARR